MRRLAGSVALALAIAVAFAAIAGAARINHTGTVTDVADSKVAFAVTKRKGDLKNVRNLKFIGLPVSCSDGSAGVVELRLPKIKVKGKRFAANLPVQGAGIAEGKGRSSGKFRRGGKRASGKVAVNYTQTTGVSCQTGELAWKTSRR